MQAETGETAIEMTRRARIRRPVVLEHLLDEIDASARTVELVAGQRERSGRSPCRSRNARRRAGFSPIAPCRDFREEPAENASASDQNSALSRPRSRICAGSKLSFTRRESAASAGGLRLKDADAGPDLVTARKSVAWPPRSSTIGRSTPACASSAGSKPSQTRPPAQS